MLEINTGDTAWVLISAALVLLMTVPGLALFYGGMVRAKSTLNMMMMSFGALIVVGIIWVTFGYSVAFGPALDSNSFLEFQQLQNFQIESHVEGLLLLVLVYEYLVNSKQDQGL